MLISLFSLSLKNALFRLDNYPEFSRFFLCDQRYRLEDTMRNTLDISEFRNQVHHRMFFTEWVTDSS